MKIKAKDIRQMSREQIAGKMLEVRKELMRLNSQIAVGTIPEKPGRVKQVKKTIARMLTIINEKQRQPSQKAAGKEGKKGNE